VRAPRASFMRRLQLSAVFDGRKGPAAMVVRAAFGAVLFLSFIGCSAHAARVEVPAERSPTSSESASLEYRRGPVALRLGEAAALLVPEGCRVRCAGSSFAEVECADTRLEARSPAWLWPRAQNEERAPGGAISQWGQYGDDFAGVLVASGGHFALVERHSTDAGRSRVLSLLRSYHMPGAGQSHSDCPVVLY
jgi:hypothetical protein